MTEVTHMEYNVFLDLLFYDIIAVLYFIVLGFLVYNLFTKRTKMEKDARPFLHSLTLFFFIGLVGSIFVMIYLRNTNFNTNQTIQYYEYYVLLNLLGMLLALLAPLYLIYVLERTFFKSDRLKERHLVTKLQLIIITILVITVMVFIIIFYYTIGLEHILTIISLIVFSLFICLIILQFMIFFSGFLYLGIKSSGEFRQYSILVAVGYFFEGALRLYSGLVINGLHRGIYPWPSYTVFFFMGFLNLLIILSTLIMFYSLVKLYSIEEIKVDDAKFQDVITTFIRPRKLTDEEITFYKEQKICMVCKGKAIGFNIYVCSECDALYCKKCATALISQENACWGCNYPFDASRPSKPFKPEEEKEKKESEGVDIKHKKVKDN